MAQLVYIATLIATNISGYAARMLSFHCDLPPTQLLWVLEHLAAVTSQPAETPNEREFQSQYGDIITSALQRLRNPSNFSNPHTVWEPFKEVYIYHPTNIVYNYSLPLYYACLCLCALVLTDRCIGKCVG